MDWRGWLADLYPTKDYITEQLYIYFSYIVFDPTLPASMVPGPVQRTNIPIPWPVIACLECVKPTANPCAWELLHSRVFGIRDVDVWFRARYEEAAGAVRPRRSCGRCGVDPTYTSPWTPTSRASSSTPTPGRRTASSSTGTASCRWPWLGERWVHERRCPFRPRLTPRPCWIHPP